MNENDILRYTCMVVTRSIGRTGVEEGRMGVSMGGNNGVAVVIQDGEKRKVRLDKV